MMFHQNPENFVGYSNEYHKWRNRKLLLYICTIKLVPPRKNNHGTLFHVNYTCMYLDLLLLNGAILVILIHLNVMAIYYYL